MLNGEEVQNVLQTVHTEQITEFHRLIENQVAQGVGVLEAIVAVCDQKGIEVEDVVPFLSNKILSDLQRHCQKANLVDRKTPARVDLSSVLG